MSVTLEQITFDSNDVPALAAFWAQVFETEVDRLVGLGAKRLDEYDEYAVHWITFADPEGNLFDLAELR